MERVNANLALSGVIWGAFGQQGRGRLLGSCEKVLEYVVQWKGLWRRYKTGRYLVGGWA